MKKLNMVDILAKVKENKQADVKQPSITSTELVEAAKVKQQTIKTSDTNTKPPQSATLSKLEKIRAEIESRKNAKKN